MAVLTEQMLRARYSSDTSKIVYVEPGTKLTPSAKEFIRDRELKIVEVQEDESSLFASEVRFQEKPEAMTTVSGNRLVFKNHPRIVFRGLVDSLEGEILYTLSLLKDNGNKKVVRGLEEIYSFCRHLLRGEVLGEEVSDFSILGSDSDEIREYSHKPSKYFDVDHFTLTGDESTEILLLNRLRTKVRELETHAIQPFARTKGEERPDILKALNRMSSGFYYLMILSKASEKLSED